MTDMNEVPVAPSRTWKVIIIMTDTPGSRQTYLTKEQVINAAMYANRVQGLHIVKSDASLIELNENLSKAKVKDATKT